MKNLGAQPYIIRQGHSGHLCAHLIGKPCSVYNGTFFSTLGYLKDHIEYIEQYKLPMCPSVTMENLQDHFLYCIYTYNSKMCNKIKSEDSTKYEQETTASLLRTSTPLMSVPEDAVLSVYFIISKKCLINLSNKKQEQDFNRIRGIDKHQSIDDASSFLMISDEQLCIFMKYLTKYLCAEANVIGLEQTRKVLFLE